MTTDREQQDYFDSLEAYELLEWATVLSQMALDARNLELAKPLPLLILEPKDVGVPY
jgi:hypothetical protein